MKCRYCGADTKLLCELNPIPLTAGYRKEPDGAADRYPLRLMGCSCGYVGLDHVINPYLLYPNNEELVAQSASATQHLTGYAESLAATLSQGSTVLDIGSNDGTFLSVFKKRGHLVLGIEPSIYAKAAAERLGIQTLSCFFDDDLVEFTRDWSKYDLVTASRVWSNMLDSVACLGHVKDLLLPEGRFIIETGYLPNILEKMLVETIYHEHISYDMVQPMQQLCREHGMVVTHVDYVPIKGGSIRLTIRHEGAADDTVGRACERETRWLTSMPWQRFQTHLMAEEAGLAEDICKGGIVCGYGAGVPGTALIFQLGLEDKLSWVVDEQERYWGTYVPGTNLEIRGPDSLDESDQCVILAHRYADQIKAKHPEYKAWAIPFQDTATRSSKVTYHLSEHFGSVSMRIQ